MGVLHALNGSLHILLVKDIFQQLHHLGDVQFLNLRCDTFQSFCDGAETVRAAFVFAVLIILLTIFKSGDFIGELFDFLFILLFSVRSFSSSGLGLYSMKPPLSVGVFRLVSTK